MTPHFELQPTNSEGIAIGRPITCRTEKGVYINCPRGVRLIDVQHFCMLARSAPNHPVEITKFQTLPSGERRLEWSARLHWREEVSAAQGIPI